MSLTWTTRPAQIKWPVICWKEGGERRCWKCEFKMAVVVHTGHAVTRGSSRFVILPKLEARAIVAFANLLVSGVWISELGEELLLTTRLASTRMYTVYLYIRSQYAA